MQVEVKINWNLFFDMVGRYLTAKLRERVPVVFGDLKKSISYKVEGKSCKIMALEYGWYVEFGTLPHAVNPEWLKPWAKKKFGDEKIAYPVAYHIRTHGTKSNPWIRETLANHLSEIVEAAMKYPGVITARTK